MIADIEKLLRVCGTGSYLQIGCGANPLVFDLLKRSIEAFGMDPAKEIIANLQERAPSRFFQGSLTQYPFNEEAFDTIIIGEELFNFKPNDLAVVFQTLMRMTKRHLVLYFPAGLKHLISPTHPLYNRLVWEKIAIEAGFRRHPREMLAHSYADLENETMGCLTFFERIPEVALQRFPLSWLLSTRDLHMDMLREAGRRSDGHVARYVHAISRIRPGDTVLDAACGLGYGTAVLAACSPGAKFIGVDIDPESIDYASANFAVAHPGLSYQVADVSDLSFLPDHSIDTVVSFETIEHVMDYDIFLKEVKRVLKPDGRIIGSVPNLWCDETGRDPNPFHFHVFDWKKVKEAVSKYFILESRWAQNAGGGFKLRNSQREFWNVPLENSGSIETEWWVFSACANPLEKSSQSFTNQFHKDKNLPVPPHVDFEKYYDNPWIYRAMVQLGERVSDRQALTKLCVSVSTQSRLGSADQGAALCVLCHQLLESGYITFQNVVGLVSSINLFDQKFDRDNLHAYRWNISLHYVAARLLLCVGNIDDALNTFLTCATMDPVKFSPLLATKTISARMYAGLILAGRNQLEEAEEQFRLGISESHRVMQGGWENLIGNWEDPLPFGLPEAAEVLDIASQCVHALRSLKRQGSTPGYFWERIQLKRFGLVEWNRNLEKENAILRHQVAKLAEKEQSIVSA